jgi:hypothetical protein
MNGGNGGAGVEMIVNATGSSRVRVDGLIDLEGEAGRDGGGSGSGGSFALYTDIFEGGKSGRISTRGGMSESETIGGGAGSGGRIALYVHLLDEFEGEVRSSSGRAPDGLHAAAGTVYWHMGDLDTFNETVVVIDNEELFAVESFDDHRYSWLSGSCRDVYRIHETLIRGDGRIEFGNMNALGCSTHTSIEGSISFKDASQGRWWYSQSPVTETTFVIRDDINMDHNSSVLLDDVDVFSFTAGRMMNESTMYLSNEGRNGTHLVADIHFEISNASKITGDGFGFSYDTSNTMSGCSLAGSRIGSGGSFGGEGGRGGTWGCGSVDDMFLRGNGGRSGSEKAITGGNGGNAVWITVMSPVGLLVVDGSVMMRGTRGSDSVEDLVSGGGGSGGSISITTSSLEGKGILSVTGGDGGTSELDDSEYNGGGGSGGRIFLTVEDPSDFTGSVEAFGGFGGSSNTSLPHLAGAPGTILWWYSESFELESRVDRPPSKNRVVVIDNNNRVPFDDVTDWAASRLGFPEKPFYEINETRIVGRSRLLLDVTAVDVVDMWGSLSIGPSSRVDAVGREMAPFSRINFGEDVLVSQQGSIYLHDIVEFRGEGVMIEADALLKVLNPQSPGIQFNLKSFLFVEKEGELDGNGGGVDSGFDARFLGDCSVLNRSSSGGSYGGQGGNGGPVPCGDFDSNFVRGTPGGSTAAASGGNGGNAVNVTLLNGVFDVNGSISVNGYCGINNDVCPSSGGSGGSLWIHSDHVSGEGVLSADGGCSGDAASHGSLDELECSSASGGGGRIAVLSNRRDKESS